MSSQVEQLTSHWGSLSPPLQVWAGGWSSLPWWRQSWLTSPAGAPWRWGWRSPASASPPSPSTRSSSCWWSCTPGGGPSWSWGASASTLCPVGLSSAHRGALKTQQRWDKTLDDNSNVKLELMRNWYKSDVQGRQYSELTKHDVGRNSKIQHDDNFLRFSHVTVVKTCTFQTKSTVPSRNGLAYWLK